VPQPGDRESRLITVRAAETRDAAAIAEIYGPFVESTAVSFEEQAPGPREIAQRIEATIRTYPWLVWDHDGAILGYAYAGEHRTRPAYRWSTDVSVYVAPSAQRQGVGRGLYGVLLELLALQGFRNAFAGIALPNAASVALHESLGFAHLGTYRAVGFKLGQWHDVGWWQKTLRAPGAAPGELIAFSALPAASCDRVIG
jgi:L-amino acid N-acyltransferase YncA